MPSAEPIEQPVPEAAKPIDAGTAEVDAGGLLEVFGGTGDLADDGAAP